MHVIVYFLHKIQILLESYLEVRVAHLQQRPSDITLTSSLKQYLYPFGERCFAFTCTQLRSQRCVAAGFFQPKMFGVFCWGLFRGAGGGSGVISRNQPYDLWQMLLLLGLSGLFLCLSV